MFKTNKSGSCYDIVPFTLDLTLRKRPTPEDNYIYASCSAVLYVRKHVLQIVCPNPLTPTAGASASTQVFIKERK